MDVLKNIIANFSTAPNEPPVIDSFTADPTSGPAPLAVTFTCNAHDDGSVVQYQWDFDGDDVVDKATRSARASHTYSAAGTYQARVTVVDNTQETTTSDPLAITANDVAYLRLISPNGGESFTAGMGGASIRGSFDTHQTMEPFHGLRLISEPLKP
jgi:PKD repeat protein